MFNVFIATIETTRLTCCGGTLSLVTGRCSLKTIDNENSSQWSGMFNLSRLRKAAVLAVNLKSATKSLRRRMLVAFSHSYEEHSSQFINGLKRNGSEFKCF